MAGPHSYLIDPLYVLPDGAPISFGGVASIFWETADANANYLAFELPAGDSVDVPVSLFGIGLDGVDLGLFNGVTMPTLGIMDADRDTALVMDYSGDDAARIRTLGTTRDLTVAPTGDLVLAPAGFAVMIDLASSAPSPDGTAVHLWRGTAGSVVANTRGILVLEDDANLAIQLLSPNNTSQSILFGDPENNSIGSISYEHSANSLTFKLAGSDTIIVYSGFFVFQSAFRIDTTAGDLTLNPAGTVVTTKAIVFSTDVGAPAGTVTYINRNDADLDYNVSSGDVHMFRINQVAMLQIGVSDVTLTPVDNVIFAAGRLILRESIDSAAVADEVSISRFDIGAGNTVFAISQETTVATEVDETKFSHKMQIRINGATYFMMLTAT
jgi:hypothetical protein